MALMMEVVLLKPRAMVLRFRWERAPVASGRREVAEEVKGLHSTKEP